MAAHKSGLARQAEPAFKRASGAGFSKEASAHYTKEAACKKRLLSVFVVFSYFSGKAAPERLSCFNQKSRAL